MTRWLVRLVLLIALVVPTGAQAAQTLTVVNDNGVPHRTLVQTERAIVAQSKVLRQYWGTPLVRFGSDGWRIAIVRYNQANALGFTMRAGEAAYHDHTADHHPYAVVGERRVHQLQSVLLDHEVLEMLVDPYGDRYINYELVEIVDPVEQYATYGLGHVMLADFVKPGFYALHSHVRWFDWLHDSSAR